MTSYKLGKTPARPGAVKLAFSDYAKTAALPPHPKSFGHEGVVKSGHWGMFLNDRLGDCVIAGAAHETILWNLVAGHPVQFSNSGVESDYSAITGFDPKHPDTTDNGTDMQVAADYRRKTGMVDAHGVRHKVGAYLAIKAGNVEQHLEAAWLFGAVGFGFNVPNYAMDQFSEGKPWDLDPSADGTIAGGHYVCIVGFDGTYLLVVTWGKLQKMTAAFMKTFNDESICYLSDEMLKGGKSLEGFDLAALQTDFKAITTA